MLATVGHPCEFVAVPGNGIVDRGGNVVVEEKTSLLGLLGADVLRLGDEAQRFVAPKAFGANGQHTTLSLTHLAFNNLLNSLKLGFGFGADSPNFILEQ